MTDRYYRTDSLGNLLEIGDMVIFRSYIEYVVGFTNKCVRTVAKNSLIDDITPELIVSIDKDLTILRGSYLLVAPMKLPQVLELEKELRLARGDIKQLHYEVSHLRSKREPSDAELARRYYKNYLPYANNPFCAGEVVPEPKNIHIKLNP